MLDDADAEEKSLADKVEEKAAKGEILPLNRDAIEKTFKNVIAKANIVPGREELQKATKWLGVDVSGMIAMSGVPDDGEITVDTQVMEGGKPSIYVTWAKPGLVHAMRSLYNNHPEYGEGLTLKADSLKIVDESERGKGLGTQVFSRMVEWAKKAGVKRIVTEAAKGAHYNEYYTWARLGYDAPIPENTMRDIKRHAMETDVDLLRGRGNNISDLMATPQGREFWKKYGVSTDMTFDLSDDSLSMRVFNEYAKAKRNKAA